MAFDSLLGQDIAKATLERALTSGKLHHALRFEGPEGVGKTTAALLLARALVCPEDPLGCGACSACQRATTLTPEAPEVPKHPDVVFVKRGLYPANLIGASEATGIGVEQVRRIVLSRMGFGAHEGHALVFVIHDADELTNSAANALLKTLEEPPPGTHFILVTSRPARLIDTVRSRTLALRFGPLSSATLEELLSREGLDPSLAELAQGSLARARELGTEEAREKRQSFLDAARRALEAPHVASGIEFADARPEDRGDLIEHLRILGSHFAERGRRAPPEEARRAAACYREVERASVEIERNGAPALILESLMVRLRQWGGRIEPRA